MSIVKSTSGEHHYAHHFDSAEHEYDSAKQGIWLFLVTEVLMFGGLFVGYVIFHQLYPETFAEGASHLNWMLGTINTVVLLTSSLTMALGVNYCQTRQREKAIVALSATLLCGAMFMCIKYMEYSAKIHHGLLPGSLFSYPEAHTSNLGLYFSFYFVMTGLHGSHVLIGMGLITWVLVRTIRGEFGPEFYTPVEGVGLFWHLVDLIWIYLFPLLYLVE